MATTTDGVRRLIAEMCEARGRRQREVFSSAGRGRNAAYSCGGMTVETLGAVLAELRPNEGEKAELLKVLVRRV